MNNVKVRKALFEANMKQWQLASLMGITEWTLSRKLRNELPEADKKEIIKLIKTHQAVK